MQNQKLRVCIVSPQLFLLRMKLMKKKNKQEKMQILKLYLGMM